MHSKHILELFHHDKVMIHSHVFTVALKKVKGKIICDDPTSTVDIPIRYHPLHPHRCWGLPVLHQRSLKTFD